MSNSKSEGDFGSKFEPNTEKMQENWANNTQTNELKSHPIDYSEQVNSHCLNDGLEDVVEDNYDNLEVKTEWSSSEKSDEDSVVNQINNPTPGQDSVASAETRENETLFDFLDRILPKVTISWTKFHYKTIMITDQIHIA